MEHRASPLCFSVVEGCGVAAVRPGTARGHNGVASGWVHERESMAISQEEPSEWHWRGGLEEWHPRRSDPRYGTKEWPQVWPFCRSGNK